MHKATTFVHAEGKTRPSQHRLRTHAAIAGMMALTAHGAGPHAQEIDLSVSAEVQDSCSVTTSASDGVLLPFGQYDPADVTTAQSHSSFDVQCTGGGELRVAADFGQHMGTSLEVIEGDMLLVTNQRRMQGAGSYLTYGIGPESHGSTMADASVTSGDPSSGPKWGMHPRTYPVADGGGTVTVEVYGFIPAGQHVPAGDYEDLVTMTFTFVP